MKVFIFLSYCAILLAQFVISTKCQDNRNFQSDPYWHREVLDPRGKYQLEWQVDWTQERVNFNVTVATRGYVALGLTRNGKMEGADIVMGGVASNGKPYFGDYHAIGNEEPVMDQRQDWVLNSARENRTHTFLSFSRPFDTCDEHDIPIGDDSLFVLWSYGERDNVTNYHYENRGSYITYLRDPDLTPQSVREDTQAPGGIRPQLGPGVERWTVREHLIIPAQRTTYWCNFRKFRPLIPGKRHVIGHNVRMNAEARTHMHHMLLMRCTPPPGVNPNVIYEPFINDPGEECYDLVQPIGKLPTQFCTELLVGHAIGGRPFFLPGELGTPIGETNPQEYYLLQIHYDNPTNRPNISAHIEVDVYYTSKLREIEDGSLNLGTHVPGSPALLLPPKSIEHRIHGHCSPECTQKMFPAQGITVFAAMLHSHNAGRRLKIQHFRNGRELPWILSDDNYKFQFQNLRLLRNEVTVLPGDQMVMTCFYDNSATNTTTVGGYGTDQEMCQGFLRYYSRLEGYPTCRTDLVSPQYNSRYLAGTTNLTWDQSRLECMAIAPTHVAGMTVSQISDSPYVNWNISQRSALQRDHIVHPQVTICPSMTELAAALLLGVSAAPNPQFASYPVQIARYQPPQRCSLRG